MVLGLDIVCIKGLGMSDGRECCGCRLRVMVRLQGVLSLLDTSPGVMDQKVPHQTSDLINVHS